MSTAQFWGGKGRSIVKYSNCLPWAVQKRLNRSKCRLGYGRSWPKEPWVRWKPGWARVQGKVWGRKQAGPGHVRTCPAVNLLNATEQGQHRYGADVDWSVLDGVHIGATWRIRLNCPGTAAALYQITLTTCHSRPALVLDCCKGDNLSQWETPTSDPCSSQSP